MQNFLKYFPVFILFLILSVNASGQFLHKGKGPYSVGSFVSYSDSGDLYLAGNMVCKLTVDTMTARVNSCDSNTVDPKLNFFTLKMSSEGEIRWIKNSSISGSAPSFNLSGISSDHSNNSYLTGTYSNTLPVDSVTSMSTSSEQDGFVLKRTWNGEADWVLNGFSIESNSMCNIDGIKSDTAGNSLIYGSFRGKCHFGNDTLNAAREQLFIARIKPDMQCDLLAYGEQRGDSSYSYISDLLMNDSGMFVTLHAEDSVVLYAKDSLKMLAPRYKKYFQVPYTDSTFLSDTTFKDSIIYDPAPPTIDTVVQVVDYITHDTILTDTFYIDSAYLDGKFSYLAKLPNDSVFKQIDRGYFPETKRLTTDQSGNLYLLVNYDDSCIVQEDTLVAIEKRKFILAKYTDSGGFDWNHSANSSSTDAALIASSVTTDEMGYIYLGGRYGDSIRNDAFEFAASYIDSSQNTDGFVIKIQPNGNVVWMQRAGGGVLDEINDLVSMDSVNIIGTGQFTEYIEFGKLSDSNFYGEHNLFAATIDPYPSFDFSINPGYEGYACKGDSMLFSVTEDPDFEYQWLKDGIPIPGADSSTVYLSDSGSYSVKVTNVTIHYTRESKPIDFKVQPIPEFSIWTNDDTTFCEGQYARLKTETQSSEHSYQWFRDGIFTGHSDRTIDAYQSGDYHVRVISSYGCDSSSRSIDITSLPYPSATITPDETSFCDGDSLDLQAPQRTDFSFRWFNDNTELEEDTTSVLRIYNSGTYSVIVSNRIGCSTNSSQYSYNVIPSPNAILSFIGDSVLCEEDSTILAANTGLDFTYKWYRNNVEIPGEDEFSIKVGEPGTYSVDVGYLNSCSRRSNYKTIEVNPNPVTPLNINGNTSICEGQHTTLSTPQQSGNGYNWYTNGAPISGASSHEYDVTESGDYRVEEVNPYGCSTFSDYQRIIVKPAPDAALFHERDSVFCEGDSVRLYTYEFSGYDYTWMKDEQIISGEENPAIIVKNSGDYSVLVEDTELNCSSTSSKMKVVAVDAPDAPIESDKAFPMCDGDSALLKVPTHNNWSYQWYFDDSEIYKDTTSSMKAADQGTYKIEMVNEAGCKGFSPSIELTLKPNPVPRITVNGLFISTKSYDDIQWNLNGVALENSNNPVYLVQESGKYSVTVFHENGCDATSETVVICKPVPEVTIDEDLLKASEGSAYQWYYGHDTIKGATQQHYHVQMSGHYSVDVTKEGCTSRSQEVEVCIPVPVIEVKEQDVLEASAGQRYQWYRGSARIQDADARMYAVKETGWYKVEVEDFDGCVSFSKPVEVVVDTAGFTPTAAQSFSLAGIKTYPNPSYNLLHLDLSELDYSEAELKFTDITGKTVLRKKKTYSSQPHILSLAKLRAGIYILEVKVENEVFRGKIIKK